MGHTAKGNAALADQVASLPANEIHGHVPMSTEMRAQVVKALRATGDVAANTTGPIDTPAPAPITNTPEWRDSHPVLSDDRTEVRDPLITAPADDTVPAATKGSAAVKAKVTKASKTTKKK